MVSNISALLTEIIYNFIIISSCVFIFLKTRKIYNLTAHEGIRAFRNAFLFWGLAFIARFVSYILRNIFVNLQAVLVSDFALYYTLSLGGFYLVYSLVWKNLEGQREMLLHGTAIVIALTEVFYLHNIVYVTQLVVLLFGITISYSNYQQALRENRKSFQQLYFIGLILAIIGYLVNYAAIFIVRHYPIFTYYAYAITAGAFFIFVFGVIKTLK
jgi:hypothetical protein